MSENPTWDDPYWVEKSDTVEQRRLRRHQGWWRESHTDESPGHIARRERPVVSMLPDGVELEVNLWTDEARAAYERARDRLAQVPGPGLIEEDRLRRNLLSSQPLCFNLFGYLAGHPEALLPWVQSVAAGARSVTSVELEWAPAQGALARSAFDALVVYETTAGSRGFLGIECKYAEKLMDSQRNAAAEKFLDATRAGGWKVGAEEALDHHGLRQFWYNTLLAQQVQSGFDEGRSLVVALDADAKARAAVAHVAEQLEDPGFLVFDSIEHVVSSVEGHDEWRDAFRRRYLSLELSA